MNQGYNQLELEPNSRYITTFLSHIGLWRFKCLNFGISSAAEVFQNAIRETLAGLQGVINVSDDILIFGKSQAEHDASLKSCFQRLRENGLTLNASKCVYNKTSLDFLGYTFTDGGIKVDQKKVDAVVHLPDPSNQSEVRSLLGMINFCSRFIPRYADLTRTLRELTHKSSPWTWTSEHSKALNKLKEALAGSPTLSYFDIDKETAIFLDASPVGVAAILTQSSGDSMHTIAYASRALSTVESRYSQTEREALAVIWACEHFHIYIYGRPVTVYTDHKPLVSIFGNPNSLPPARIERWSLRLQPYNATVVYKAGSDNPADYMSRHPYKSTGVASREEKVAEEYINFLTRAAIPKAMTLDELQSGTQSDPTLQAVIAAIKSGSWILAPDTTVSLPAFETYSKLKDELSINDECNLVLRQRCLVVPDSLRKRAVQLAHEGHLWPDKNKGVDP